MLPGTAYFEHNSLFSDRVGTTFNATDNGALHRRGNTTNGTEPRITKTLWFTGTKSPGTLPIYGLINGGRSQRSGDKAKSINFSDYKPIRIFCRHSQTVNNWIRTSGEYDGVIDFDKVLRDPNAPSRLLALYDSGDHGHPTDAGYKAMTDAIDLALFSNGDRH
jgi:hypothetical protein